MVKLEILCVYDAYSQIYFKEGITMSKITLNDAIITGTFVEDEDLSEIDELLEASDEILALAEEERGEY